MPSLDPCPLCGSSEVLVAGIHDQDGYKAKAQCQDGEAEGPAIAGGNFEPKNKRAKNALIVKAIKAWNRRAP